MMRLSTRSETHPGLAATLAAAMMAATIVHTAGPASAGTPGPLQACVNDSEFQLQIHLEPGHGGLEEIRGWINADAAIDDGADAGDADTEVGSFVIDHTAEAPAVTSSTLGSHGTPLDRWDPPLFVDVPVDPTAGPESPELIYSYVNHGADRFVAGDTLAQVYLEVDVAGGETIVSRFEAIPIEPCFGSLAADLEALLGNDGYRFDGTSGGAFAFVGETSAFAPAVRNNGPDDEGDARFSWTLDVVGATANEDDGLHAVIGEDFTWAPASPCQAVGSTGTIGFTPTISCSTGAVAADTTEAEHIAVTWSNGGHYETAMRVTSQDSFTAFPDEDHQNNLAQRSFHVLDPDDDFDGDGIDNAIDGTGTEWDTLTHSDFFGDTRSGGTTFGEVVSGDVSVSDDPTDGVTVTAEAVSTVEACGTTVGLAAGTVATLTCGSITIAVSSGIATVTLADGSTLELDADDEVTVDDDEVIVISGSVEITPEGGGESITVGAGETYNTSDPDPDPGTDTDGDGVADVADACPGTTPDSILEGDLKHHRYAWHGGEVFTSGSEQAPVFTIQDTRGCSAAQIIEELGLGRGHERFGVSHSAMEAWVGQ